MGERTNIRLYATGFHVQLWRFVFLLNRQDNYVEFSFKWTSAEFRLLAGLTFRQFWRQILKGKLLKMVRGRKPTESSPHG